MFYWIEDSIPEYIYIYIYIHIQGDPKKQNPYIFVEVIWVLFFFFGHPVYIYIYIERERERVSPINTSPAIFFILNIYISSKQPKIPEFYSFHGILYNKNGYY